LQELEPLFDLNISERTDAAKEAMEALEKPEAELTGFPLGVFSPATRLLAPAGAETRVLIASMTRGAPPSGKRRDDHPQVSAHLGVISSQAGTKKPSPDSEGFCLAVRRASAPS
jgi:hypothetical protein